MLQLQQVKKHYGTTLILDIPQLQLEENIYWIKGVNGSGKTTLLKMIAGLLPFHGDIIFRNTSIKNEPVAFRKQISWAEAEPQYPPFVTGKDLLLLYENIRKTATSDTQELLERFDMTSYINTPVGTYSAGMTKKLSLVLALLGKPPLIILDEPLITLDANTFQSVSSLILEMHREHNTFFLMSSHQDLDTSLVLSGKELFVQNRQIKMNEAAF